MHRPDPDYDEANRPQLHAPLNPLPFAVWLLALPIIAFEAAFALGQAGIAGGNAALGWRQMAFQQFAFVPDYLRLMWEAQSFPLVDTARIVTYPFVHGSFTHAAMVLVFILALGKMVGEIFRPLALLAVFFGAAVVGALVYTLLPFTHAPLYGGYPAVYGLVGAFTYILWARLGAMQANRARAFTLIGFLLFIQLVFGLIFGTGWDWVAEIAGFGTGFGLSFVVGPGGLKRAMLQIRRR
ncbi:rhomboid family intramembrane serine protease [Phaeovulum sp.]|uniref:rhomboid family intramembrane serine protease n=1 Tax=Phaeovulum sp. TaxID=2934796 RepID=UPI003561B854